jgi:hypothetical protein
MPCWTSSSSDERGVEGQPAPLAAPEQRLDMGSDPGMHFVDRAELVIQGRYVMPCPLEQVLPAASELGVIVQVRFGTAPNAIEIGSGEGIYERAGYA